VFEVQRLGLPVHPLHGFLEVLVVQGNPQEHLQQVLLVHLPQAHQVHSYHPGSGYQGMAVPGMHLQVLQELANYLLVSQCHQGMAVPGIHLQVLRNQANYLLVGLCH
jgi:hypothetical protein